MKKKYVILIIFLLVLIIPTILLGETYNTEQMLKYIKGDGEIENWFLDAFVEIDKDVAELSSSAKRLGQSIGAIGALLTFGNIGWQMQSGDREWEIMPLFKPFFISLILLNWTSFYSLIQKPFEKIAEPNMAIFKEMKKEANALRIERFDKQMKLSDYLVKEEVKQEINDAKINGGMFSKEIAEIKGEITMFKNKMKYGVQKWIAGLLETGALIILRVGVYLVYFIQKIWLYILIILGPIAIGMTLIPGFDSTLNSWIAKFININLYGFVAISILNLGQAMIMGAYKMEIDRLNYFFDSAGNVSDTGMALLPDYLANEGLMNSVIFTVVAYVITGIGVMMTPSIADTIVSAGGAGLMTKMKGSAMKTAAVGMAGFAAGRATANNVMTTLKNNNASNKVQDAMKYGKK